jgi:hypothetical protein
MMRTMSVISPPCTTSCHDVPTRDGRPTVPQPRRVVRAKSNARSSQTHSYGKTSTGELGDGVEVGSTGCVNALSWSDDGQTLLAAGDDTR